MTGTTDNKIPLRGLKILRKNYRKMRHLPEYRVRMRTADTLIKELQSKPRAVFAPNYINRAAHRRHMAIKD